MLTFRIKFNYFQGYAKTLVKYRALLSDFRWAWPHVTHAIELHHARVFDTEGAASKYSGPWRALAPFTVRARMLRLEVATGTPNDYAATPRGEQAHRRILHWTHTLRRSFTERGAFGAVRVFTRKSLEYGSRLSYVERHQRGKVSVGGRTRRRGLPANRPVPMRPPLDVVGGPSIGIRTFETALGRRMRIAGALP